MLIQYLKTHIGSIIALKLNVRTIVQNRATGLLSQFNLTVCAILSISTVYAVVLLSCSTAFARLDGEASLSYSTYKGSAAADLIKCPNNVILLDGSVGSAPTGSVCIKNANGTVSISKNGDNRNSMSSNSFVQNYSLLYSSNGAVYNNRVGKYEIALGYNWTALDTTFKSSTEKDDSYNETRGHVLYRGEITLDPKEVPFRLNAYSRDMMRNTIYNSSASGLQNFDSIFGYRNQATGINDGLHIESGATLIAGVKNGMTNGYNEILRHFPMILVDYKDTINRDLLSTSKVDNRLQRLAFVSLNKKENWFHYRHTLYEDYLSKSFDPITGKITNDPSINNYVENEIQIGTVDQHMARRWIDFSNWLKVSTDIQFSKRKSNYQAYPIEATTLNLFVTGERETWNARTFTTFNRLRDYDNKLSYQANLPLYASGVISHNTSWNARTAYRNNRDITTDSITGSMNSTNFSDSIIGYRIDAFKRALFNLSQSFDAEISQTKDSDYLTLSGGLETSSTPLFSRNIAFGASYNIKNSTTSASESSSEFMEQNVDLRGSYSVSNTLRFELSQKNTFTEGKFTAFNGTTRDSQSQLSQYYNPRAQLSNEIGNKSYHSLSTFSASWSPKPRLNAVLTATEDIFKSDLLETNSVTDVSSSISFTNEKWNIADTFKYKHGSLEIEDKNANTYSNTASLRYVHSRNVDAGTAASYSYTKSGNGSSYRDTTIEQRANYNYFTKTGVSRKILEVNETLLYTDGSDSTNKAYNKALTLGLTYYPIRQLTLVAGAGYSFVDKIKDYTMVWNASAVANFRLLQLSLEYVHGKRVYDKAVEDKFSGNIRKAF